VATGTWVILHTANIAVQSWILWGGGANRISGTIWVHPATHGWGADGVKLFAWLALLGGVFWLIVGLMDPAARWLWPLTGATLT
jgi:hypothetical protein